MYQNILEIYKKLYSLPELIHKEKVAFDFFRLCRKNYRFVVITIFNEKREFLLIRDLNKNIGWELIGGYIEKDESVEDAINRIVVKETGLVVDELQPIVIINNNFEWNGNVVSHHGIGFIAQARGQIKSKPKNIEMIYTRNLPEFMAYQDKEILKIAQEIMKNRFHDLPYEEIEGIKKFFLFYYLNKYFIKKTINKLVSKKIQNVVLKLISSNPNSICDVACGDDNLILKLEKIYNPEICVANDISWKILSLIRKNNKESKVIFTNHDVLDLPFKKKFDLIILKNTLHHIPKEEQINLIQKLSDLSKQLIIIDVEDPYRSSFLTKLWHWYYVYFLGDKGKFFLNLEEFKEIINTKIKNKNVLIGIINTMKGKYFYASLLDKNQQEEVEIKVRVEKSQINSIKDQLKKEKALFVEKVKEKDSYFTSFYRDFIKTKECLRLRERANFLELTYKGPTTNLMRNKKQFWKKEINIPLNFSNKNDVENLLVLLGFKKIVEVIKEREEFILNKQKITIDKVENAGWFIEIENTIIDEKEREKALNDNLKLLNKLGIDSSNIVEEPYRDLVLKKIS